MVQVISGRALAVTALWGWMLSAAAAPAEDAGRAVRHIADDYYAAMLEFRPMRAMDAGVMPPHHDKLDDKRPRALRALERRQDAWLRSLDAVDPRLLGFGPDWVTWGVIKEDLESSVQARICHLEWWYSLNHMSGWQLALSRVADLQPVGTETERREALARWRGVPTYVRVEISNLRMGLAQGYAVPRTVAKRVLTQIDGLLAAPLDGHPYMSPATRSQDAKFRDAFRAVIEQHVMQALREYRHFLADEYLPRARATLAVTELPDGAACYVALLRRNTTLPRDAAEVYARGEETVARYHAEVIEMGQRLFGTDDYASIIQKARNAPDNQFAGRSELLPASRSYEDRAHAKMRTLFGFVPDQPLVVEPIPSYEDSAGASSHYDPPSDDGHPGIYRISLMESNVNRANAQITAYHEGWPGHHLQFSYSQRVQGLHPVMRLLPKPGYVEGWARYAEALAEEVGLYDSDYAKIQRRAWPARGMVVDPGIHAFHWTREQAVAFIAESGRYSGSTADDMVDRIAAWPGQLTAYDSGGREFFDLRREAEAALRERFDLSAFHDAALGSGSLTLPMLRTRMRAWIADRAGAAGRPPPYQSFTRTAESAEEGR